jgi:hypothetical protein
LLVQELFRPIVTICWFDFCALPEPVRLILARFEPKIHVIASEIVYKRIV